MNLNRRQMLAVGAAASAAGLAPSLYAQTAPNFPQKPLTLIVGFPPGGNIDTVARTLSIPLARNLGTSVVVDYKAGGGGAIGTGHVARSDPDGYTLLVGIPEQVTTLPHMFKTPYKLNSLQPISLASRTSVIMVTRKNDDRFKTFADVVAFARAKPGELNVGHAGPGTTNHLAILQFEDATRLKVNSVAYKGAAPAVLGLLSNQVDVIFDQVTSSMPHIKSGTLQALAIVGTAADPALPGVPTLKQLGVREFDSTTYVGVFGPANLPPAIASTLLQAIKKSLADPQMAATLSGLGSNVYAGDTEEFKKILQVGDTLAANMVQQGRLRSD